MYLLELSTWNYWTNSAFLLVWANLCNLEPLPHYFSSVVVWNISLWQLNEFCTTGCLPVALCFIRLVEKLKCLFRGCLFLLMNHLIGWNMSIMPAPVYFTGTVLLVQIISTEVTESSSWTYTQQAELSYTCQLPESTVHRNYNVVFLYLKLQKGSTGCLNTH